MTELTDADLDRLRQGLERGQVMWIIGPGNQANKWQNVRVSIKCRGRIEKTNVKPPAWMRDWNKAGLHVAPKSL